MRRLVLLLTLLWIAAPALGDGTESGGYLHPTATNTGISVKDSGGLTGASSPAYCEPDGDCFFKTVTLTGKVEAQRNTSTANLFAIFDNQDAITPNPTCSDYCNSGELCIIDADESLGVRLWLFCDGGTELADLTDYVDVDASQVLTNKTIDADANTIEDVGASNLAEDECAEGQAFVKGASAWECGSAGGAPGGDDGDLQYGTGGALAGVGVATYDETEQALLIDPGRESQGVGPGLIFRRTGTFPQNFFMIVKTSATGETPVEFGFSPEGGGGPDLGPTSTNTILFRYEEGGGTHTIVSEAQTQTLTNKTIDVDQNTVSNIGPNEFDAAECATDEIIKKVGGTWQCATDAGAGSGTPGGADTNVQFNDAGGFNGDSGFIYEKLATGVVGIENRLRLGDADSDANSACLAVSSDELYHDTDCDGTKDAGEEFIDKPGDVLADGSVAFTGAIQSSQVGATAEFLTVDPAAGGSGLLRLEPSGDPAGGNVDYAFDVGTAGTHTVAALGLTQTFTNKTLDGDDNEIRLRLHATDCTSLADGADGEPCWEEDDDNLYVCDTGDGTCDTAGEWQLVGGGGAAGVDSFEGRSGTVVSASDDYTAAEITFSPTGGVSSTDVQGAIAELDNEKYDTTGGTISGDVTLSSAADLIHDKGGLGSGAVQRFDNFAADITDVLWVVNPDTGAGSSLQILAYDPATPLGPNDPDSVFKVAFPFDDAGSGGGTNGIYTLTYAEYAQTLTNKTLGSGTALGATLDGNNENATGFNIVQADEIQFLTLSSNQPDGQRRIELPENTFDGVPTPSSGLTVFSLESGATNHLRIKDAAGNVEPLYISRLGEWAWNPGATPASVEDGEGNCLRRFATAISGAVADQNCTGGNAWQVNVQFGGLTYVREACFWTHAGSDWDAADRLDLDVVENESDGAGVNVLATVSFLGSEIDNDKVICKDVDAWTTFAAGSLFLQIAAATVDASPFVGDKFKVFMEGARVR